MKKEDSYVQFDDDAIPIKRRTSGNTGKRVQPAKPQAARQVKYTVAKPVQSSERQTSKAPSQTRRAEVKYVNSAARAHTDGAVLSKRAPHGAPSRGAVRSIPVARPASGDDDAVRLKKDKKPAGKGKDKKTFRKAFLIYVGVLLAASIIFLIYVHGLLVDFEASQVDNIVSAKLDAIKTAASRGNIEKELSLSAVKEKYSPTDGEIADYQKAFALGELSFRKTRAGLSSDTENYAILLNGFNVGTLKMKTVKEETVLAIFPVTEWKIEECSAETFSFDFPSSVTVMRGGEKVDGKPSETEGLYSYTISSLFGADTVITDSAGNTAAFNGKDAISFVNCTVTARSDYSVYSGENLIDQSKGERSPIEELKNVKEYCTEIPDVITYRLCLIDNGQGITIKDKNGAEVGHYDEETAITATDFEKSDTIPSNLAGDPNPVEIAKMLHLLMSDDLAGPWPHGFSNFAKYLIKGSDYYDNIWDWATGIDITFTSDHTLDNPPFSREETSDFISYSDECFSCRIQLDKPMNIANGTRYIDTIDSIFYFVYVDDTDNGTSDPHWALVDRR